jgi:threonylcarbamoyladenosine tRNA methylthiotransferase CDKAL1
MKIHSIHNGCEVNWADSNAATQVFLKHSDFKYSNKEDADYILFHGCTFTQHKEDETKDIILELLNTTTKKIIISGCFLKEYVQHERVQYIKNEKLPALIDSLQQEIKIKTVAEQQPKHNLLPFVAISRGCYGNCTFCSIKQAKGSNVSFKIEDILIHIEARQDLDYIKLVGDEVAGYGRDIGLNLKILVDAIIEKFPSIKLKFGSLNCKLLKIYTEAELAIFAYPNIIGNVHIPIQSASNSVLQTMSRGYTIEEYNTIYNALKSLGVANI